MMMNSRIAMMFAGAGLLAAGAQAATVTPVQPAQGSEKSHAEILSDIFGGVFVQSGNDFSNGTVQVTRVDDDSDQTYDFNTWSAKALATWASASQAFGTTDDGKLFDVTGDNATVAGSVSGVSGDGTTVFTRLGSEFLTSDVATDPTLNGDGMDHVVTYTYSVNDQQTLNDLQPLNDQQAVNGQQAEKKYLLFFEDLNEGAPRYDFDYNDLVVEVTGVVPEPGSLALLGLGGLAMLRRRR